jgi:hypothetical protein
MTERIWEHFRTLASEITGDEVDIDDLKRVANSPSTASEDHSAMCAHRYVAGWKYGEVEDERAKTSPMLRPWAELTDEQRTTVKRLRAVARCAAAVVQDITRKLLEQQP